MGSRRITGFAALTLPVIAAMVALTAVSGAAARTLRIARLSQVLVAQAPHTVYPHERVFFRALVSPGNDSCRLTIRDTAGGVQSGDQKQAHGGQVAWLINLKAAPGQATAKVSCSRGGSASVSFTVLTPKRLPIAVDNMGWTQSCVDPVTRLPLPCKGFAPALRYTFVSFGVAFQNELADSDLANVQLDVNFLDEDNVPVAPSPHPTIPLLPAGSTFYYGGRISLLTPRIVKNISVKAIAATIEPPIMSTPPRVSNQTIFCGFPAFACGQPNSLLSSVAGQVLLKPSPRTMTSATIGDVIADRSQRGICPASTTDESCPKILGGGYGIADSLALGHFESFFIRSSTETPWTADMEPFVAAVPRYVPRTLVASTLRVVPSTPRAGEAFIVSLEVVDASLGKQVAATGAQCLLPGARVRAYVSRGRATCAITAARSARGQTLTGFMTAMVGSDRVMKAFTVRLH